MEKTLEDARWGGGREEEGKEAEAAGPFSAQLLKWMALGGGWRGSKEDPSTPSEKKGMPLTLKWASGSTSWGES